MTDHEQSPDMDENRLSPCLLKSPEYFKRNNLSLTTLVEHNLTQ
jgi:hypothetical protein